MEKSQQIAPETSEKNLAELIKSGDPTICQQVARHPNASPETLRELFRQFPQAVLSNPALDLLLLENPHFFSDLCSANSNCFNKILP
ncbi:MAG: hypothetical protein QNJ72_20080 [Pleurocapsa sp. MO_226.B13]|nr:hypothetical protein [Pleurocapsa sp. MO_226.B13]